MLAFPHFKTFLFVLLISAVGIGQDQNEKSLQYFENKIRPLLVEHCYQCHDKDKQESDLRLDTTADVLAGGASGPAVVKGKPDESLILIAMNYHQEDLQMPPAGKLGDDDIASVRQWIKDGATMPQAGTSITPRRGNIDMETARQFWSFQPPEKNKLPSVANAAWPKASLDYFILSNLDANGLSPAAPASKRQLIRRVTFDLTGLPPTPDDITSFLNDQSHSAFAKVVDRLLNSHAYGERWGRHWLDVARYADSNGLDENVAHGNAWRYRDYVIKALNHDKTFDQFLVEQLAGDLLEHDSEQERIDHLVATGFLSLGPKVLAEGDEAKMEVDIIDEQIDTIGRTFMGLTLGCARCHDHKFDPIRTEDYYALAGIFKSTRTMESFKRIAKWNENEIATSVELKQRKHAEKEITDIKTSIARLIAESNEELKTQLPNDAALPKDAEQQYSNAAKKKLGDLRKKLTHLEASLPVLPTAMGVVDSDPVDTKIHIRGSHLALGKKVKRGVPLVIAEDGQPEIGGMASGRLQLARWLVRSEHPLTSRVIVNRVWRWYFGRGLVETTDNFGKLGDRPTNQPLLDHLAIGLVENNWSLKTLHREIVLSSTYQMSSVNQNASLIIDPENRMQSRASIRRLEAEEIRDSLLAVSGLVDRNIGGSMLHVGNREFVFNHTSKDETSYETTRRSIYLPVIRNHLCDVFSLFDYSDASVPTGDRSTSTIAPQALFMMNSELLEQCSQALAKRLTDECSNNNGQKVTRLYQLVLGREPLEAETRHALAFVSKLDGQVANGPKNTAERGWQALCHVLLMSSEFLHVE
jgi:cytochrome c553